MRSNAPSRRAILLPLLALLGGCGFHPLYGESAQASYEPELATIRVMPIPDRIGQQLAMSLRDALNPSGEPVPQRYNLSIALVTSEADLGIQRDASATRGRVDVYATFQLSDSRTGKPVYHGRTQTTSAYNIVNDAFAAEMADEDARSRTVRDLTDEIRLRLSLFLRDQRAASAEPARQ
jgi:LPS-assembly lipoprotein